MASVTIKRLPAGLHARLKEAARRNRRSVQDEIIAVLECHVERRPRRKEDLLAEAAALRQKLPRFDHARIDGYKRAGRL